MTVSNTQVRVSYTGDGASIHFAIPFPFYLATDITVMLGNAVQSSGYTITGGVDANGNPQTGTVTFSSAPTPTVAVQFILAVPLTQLVSLVDGTAFPSATLNQVNDRGVQAALRLDDLLSRTIIAPDGDVSPNLALPIAATRANTYLTFDSNGNLSVAQSVPSGTLSQATIGAFLYPRTSTETAASVTPTNYAYEPLDTRRYGWVNDWNGSTGTNNYTAFANALLVAAQNAGSTVRIRGGGTNQALVQGGTTLTWPDSTGIEVDQAVNIIWNDAGSGAFCLTNGGAAAHHGNIFSKNLAIILNTQTACGLHLFNTVQGCYLNTYIQGFTGSYATRSNIGLKMEATPTTGACWYNDFYGINLNHCHLGLFMPSSSGGFVTQNTFRNFRFFGDNPSDLTSIAINAQSAQACVIDGFYVEAVGANVFGFEFGSGAANWQIDNGVFDTSNGAFTAVYMAAGAAGIHLGKKVLFSGISYHQNLNLPNAQNVVESLQGTPNGESWASSAQGSVGLNAGQGFIGSFFAPATGSTTLPSGQQTILGGCYNPLDNLLYFLSNQGNILAYSPVAQQITNFNPYSGLTGDSNPMSCCFCPVNNYIYIADRQDNAVKVFNPRTYAIIQTIALPANSTPYGIAYCPFNQKIYVANSGTAQSVSIIQPTINGSDSINQTLGGFGVGLFTVAYCPITQRMYAAGNGTSVFCIATTTNNTDSIAQTIATALGTSCYALAYCPTNQKMYAASSGSTKFVSINPTTNGTDAVLTSSTLVANGNSASGTRGICWNSVANAMLCAGVGNWLATILPSASGSADICTQVQATVGGTTLGIVFHPGMAKSYEINSSVSYVPEWA